MKNKNLFNNGIVLLFSGGLDSYITAKLFNPDVLLYMNVGSKYADKEIANLRKLDIPQDRLVIDDRLHLGDIELENNIVPLRNLFFSLIGLFYGNQVMLSATKGDTTKDKDEEFKDLFNDMVDHLITEEKDDKTFPWKKENYIPGLILPVKNYTKTELVKTYLEHGFSPEGIWNTISCYNATERECGACKTCFRKAVALINNDIYKPELFATQIDWEKFVKQTIEKKRAGELEDTLKAMDKINFDYSKLL
jgi:7-cyano-7-deazaguanine synthase